MTLVEQKRLTVSVLPAMGFTLSGNGSFNWKWEVGCEKKVRKSAPIEKVKLKVKQEQTGGKP